MLFFIIEIYRFISNVLGGTIRWIYGSIWRTIFNKPKFAYKEYLFGVNNSKNYYDIHGHQFNNRVIFFIFTGVLGFLLFN